MEMENVTVVIMVREDSAVGSQKPVDSASTRIYDTEHRCATAGMARRILKAPVRIMFDLLCFGTARTIASRAATPQFLLRFTFVRLSRLLLTGPLRDASQTCC